MNHTLEETVRALQADGRGVREIAAALNELGIAAPRDGKWHATSVHRLPPPVRVEVVPAPRPGYVWAPGFWSWDRGQHIWHEGYWELERPDARFVPAHWVDTPGGWRFMPAHWEHVEHERGGFCPPGQAKRARC